MAPGPVHSGSPTQYTGSTKTLSQPLLHVSGLNPSKNRSNFYYILIIEQLEKHLNKHFSFMSTNHQALLYLDNQTCAVIGSTVVISISSRRTTISGRKLKPTKKKKIERGQKGNSMRLSKDRPIVL